MEYDWDLQVGDGGSSIDHYSEPHPFGFKVDDLLLPDHSPEKFGGTTADFEQLEGLYKPFYPVFPQTILTDSFSLQSLSQQPPAAVHAAKPKKIRKNQQKRVVQQVREDGLRSDTWAWRKYGQKPIKGSPYPRSYYRCSSSKGCVARKQVERSCSDPTTFIITYTAEHNHNGPTRRSSLAGISKREKGVEFVPLERSQSSTGTAPPNDLQAVIVEEKREVGVLEEGQKLEEAIMSKELVASLEDLEALLMDQTFLDVSPDYNWPAIQDFATLIDGNGYRAS